MRGEILAMVMEPSAGFFVATDAVEGFEIVADDGDGELGLKHFFKKGGDLVVSAGSKEVKGESLPVGGVVGLLLKGKA